VESIAPHTSVVIVDNRGDPQAVVTAEELAQQPTDRPLADLLASLPPILVGDASTPLKVARRQVAALQLSERGSLVVVSNTGNVEGILTGPAIIRQLDRAQPGANIGYFPAPRLPGPIKIPNPTVLPTPAQTHPVR
jgi:hypothetical protein